MDKLEIKHGSYTTNPVFYTGQSVQWKPMFFPDQIDFYRICPSDRMFGNLWEKQHIPIL